MREFVKKDVPDERLRQEQEPNIEADRLPR
jgi:hypothetical protein